MERRFPHGEMETPISTSIIAPVSMCKESWVKSSCFFRMSGRRRNTKRPRISWLWKLGKLETYDYIFFCCCCWRCFLDSSLTRQFKEIQQGPVLRLMESPPMMITTGVGEGKRERGGGQVSPAEEEPRTLVTSSMATDRLAVVSDAQRRWHVGWGRVDESASLSPPSLAPSLGCIFYIYFLCVCVCCVSSLSPLSPFALPSVSVESTRLRRPQPAAAAAAASSSSSSLSSSILFENQWCQRKDGQTRRSYDLASLVTFSPLSGHVIGWMLYRFAFSEGRVFRRCLMNWFKLVLMMVNPELKLV